MKINIKKIIQTISDVEEKYQQLDGKSKKEKAVKLINDFIDIPILPESIEEKFISVIVDIIVEMFNQLLWKK